jgi:epoxyqueuosine reductase
MNVREGRPRGTGVGRTEESIRKEITEEIKRFVRDDPANRLELDGDPIYAEPLIGFASGQDPLFRQLKEVIGEFHLTPHEAMLKASQLRNFSPPSEEMTSVISYVLPIHSMTVKANAEMTDRPSRRWVHGRLHGESFRDRLSAHIICFLDQKGLIAISPENEAGFYFKTIDPRIGYTSNWSQRHIAYAAGLGSFGLSDGLITEAGIAEAVGSIVVGARFSSPERSGDIHANCLFFQKGTCKACVGRCPVGAITEAGHDKNKCAGFAFSQTPLNKERYGIDIYSCGLCLTGVPCSMRNPMRPLSK